MSRLPILAVPCCESGRGGGHIVRCMNLVRELRERGREAFLFIARENEITERLRAQDGFNPEWIFTKENAAFVSARQWECIITDNFQTAPKDFLYWQKIAPLAGIDEGGPCRSNFDFLIDILPNLASRLNPPNISDPSLLNLPEKKRAVTRNYQTPLKTLVSFGQEDSAGLGLAAARALAAKNKNNCLAVTLVSRNGISGAGQGGGFTVRENIPCLAEHLAEYDLLVTHYGITAFEALYAGVPTLLLSPSAYHEKLAKTAGFYSAGFGRKRAKKIAALVYARDGIRYHFLDKLEKNRAALAARYNLPGKPKQNLAGLIDSFAPQVNRACPVCGVSRNGRTAARFPERTYFRCPVCGVIYMNRVNPPPVEYAREYFFDFYKKQYGKTYIEDFPNLMSMAKTRLARIQKLLPAKKTANEKRRLLDIGCAYGPFLAAAQESDFSPEGFDPAADAVKYVRETFNIPARRGCFPDDKLPEADSGAFDVITLWYVIEHFRNCAAAFAEVKRILKPRGILAFSTPSCAGVSGRASLYRFLERSPADHYTIWPPVMCKRALRRAGFAVKKIVSTGHHPERFPLLGKYARSEKSPLYKVLLFASKIFALGDTFEVYAVKTK